MKKILLIPVGIVMMGLLLSCSVRQTYHQEPLPDPKGFNAHFPDMDEDGDDLVQWREFKAYHPHAKPGIFKALDLSEDGAIDHDEWHQFKEAHGLKHLE